MGLLPPLICRLGRRRRFVSDIIAAVAAAVATDPAPVGALRAHVLLGTRAQDRDRRARFRRSLRTSFTSASTGTFRALSLTIFSRVSVSVA